METQTFKAAVLSVGHMTPQVATPSFWGNTGEWQQINVPQYFLRGPRNFTVWIKYFKFLAESKVPLFPAHPVSQKSCFLFNPKQGSRMRQMMLKNDKHAVGAYFYPCNRTVGRNYYDLYIRIYKSHTLESNT
jgi:hypothetical protein